MPPPLVGVPGPFDCRTWLWSARTLVGPLPPSADATLREQHRHRHRRGRAARTSDRADLRGVYLGLVVAWLGCGDAGIKRAVLAAAHFVTSIFKALASDPPTVRLRDDDDAPLGHERGRTGTHAGVPPSAAALRVSHMPVLRAQLVGAVLAAVQTHIVDDAALSRAAKLGVLNGSVLHQVRRIDHSPGDPRGD